MKDISKIKGFHFHVYYSDLNREVAEGIFKRLAGAHWYDYPTGPHTEPMFVVEVSTSYMENIYKFFILNRQGLSVLIHPLTDNELEDHTTSVGWLGTPVPLDLDKL